MRNLIACCILLSILPLLQAEGVSLRLHIKDAIEFKDVKRNQHTKADLYIDWQKGSTRAWAWSPLQPGQEAEGTYKDGKFIFTLHHNRPRPTTIGGKLIVKWDGKSKSVELQQIATPLEAYTNIEKAWGMGRIPGLQAFREPTLKNQIQYVLVSQESKTKTLKTKERKDPLAKLELSTMQGHPRLFFKPEQLEQLKAAAKTPKAIRMLKEMEALLERERLHGFGFHAPKVDHFMHPGWGVGYALLYQLSGDKKHAEKSANLVRQGMIMQTAYGNWWRQAYRIMHVAMAYDLCYHAWDEQMRQQTYAFLYRNASDIALRPDVADVLNTRGRYVFGEDQSDFRFKEASHSYAIMFRAAAALAALSILNDKPAIYEPQSPDDAITIKPTQDTLRMDVPVVPYKHGKMARQWLINGPFLPGEAEKAMEQFGGMGKLTPTPGESLNYHGQTLDFRVYWPAAANRPSGPHVYPRDCARYWASSTGGGFYPGIRLLKKWTEEKGKRPGTEVVLYTVIENKRERVVQAKPNWGSQSAGVRMWLNEKELKDGEVARLLPGKYHWKILLPVTGGYATQAPHLANYSQKQFEKDMQAATDANATLNGPNGQLTLTTKSLLRSVNRFLELEVDEYGDGLSPIQQTWLPLAISLYYQSGIELWDGELRKAAHHALLVDTKGSRQLTRELLMQSYPLLDQKGKLSAHEVTKQGSLGITRPSDALLTLVAIANSLEEQEQLASEDTAQAWQTYKRYHHFTKTGRLLIRENLGKKNDQRIDYIYKPLEERSLWGLGRFGLHALGQELIQAGGYNRTAASREWLSTLNIKGVYPAEAFKITKEEINDRHTLVVSSLAKLREGKSQGQGNKASFTWGKPLKGAKWQRAIYSERLDEKHTLFIIADKIEGLALYEQSWQALMPVKTDQMKLNPRKPEATINFRTHPRRDQEAGHLQVQAVLPKGAKFGKKGYLKGAAHVLHLKMNQKKKRGPKITIDDEHALDPDDEMTDLLEEFDKELEESDRKEKAKAMKQSGEAEWVLVVIQLSKGKSTPKPIKATLGKDGKLKVTGKIYDFRSWMK